MRITIADRSADAVVGDDGAWVVQLGPLEPGGPYRLEVRVDGGDEPVIAHDVYAGEVFICAGQSNMEYQMEFLRWRYPSEYTREPDPLLRHCKVPVRFDFHGPRRDFDEPVRWVGAVADTLDEFTGVGYFFGRMVRAWLGVPVGLLNITLGGSPIESWMDEETLAAWPKALADLEPYRDDEVARTRSEESIAAMNRWYEDLRTRETEAQSEDLGHGTLTLPAFLKDADPRLTGFRGVIHLRRTVTLPAYAAGQSAALHLGAMVDSDETFVNGVKVGQSEHQYLSRDYMVPEGVLKAGCNEIDVRLVVEHGTGRVTPGKHMHLDMGDDSYNLDGTWTYSIGARTDADCPGEDFVRWKPLGLYNGMTATCAGYAARAALWYQGESNTGDVADDYGRMLAAMIGCWRKAWGAAAAAVPHRAAAGVLHRRCGGRRLGTRPQTPVAGRQVDRGRRRRGDPRRGRLERPAPVEQERGRRPPVRRGATPRLRQERRASLAGTDRRAAGRRPADHRLRRRHRRLRSGHDGRRRSGRVRIGVGRRLPAHRAGASRRQHRGH